MRALFSLYYLNKEFSRSKVNVALKSQLALFLCQNWLRWCVKLACICFQKEVQDQPLLEVRLSGPGVDVVKKGDDKSKIAFAGFFRCSCIATGEFRQMKPSF